MTWTNIIAIILYALVSRLIWLRARGDSTNADSARWTNAVAIRWLAAAAACLHGIALYRAIAGGGAINLALGNVASLVAWMSVALLLAATFARQTLSLGVIVMPLALLGLAVGWLVPGEALLLDTLPRGVGRHIAVAVLAYGVLSIAFAQALVLLVQERQLRKPNPGGWLPALPALETMESNLFQLTLLGFALLCINLFTGMATTRAHHGALLLFNHHILLALIAWAGFGALLLGHRLFGWRGQTAAAWTIIAFTVLALAYFGTRFVSGVILAS